MGGQLVRGGYGGVHKGHRVAHMMIWLLKDLALAKIDCFNVSY